MELVRHRGRWTAAKTVEVYVQEVGGERFLASLVESARCKIAAAAREERGLLLNTIRRIYSENKAEANAPA